MKHLEVFLKFFKKLIHFGLKAFILGIAIGIVWFTYYLYTTFPQPVNDAAITATFERIGTSGINNFVTFSYILKNNTSRDYDLWSYGYKLYITRLDGSLSQATDNLSFDTPLHIPKGEAMYVTFTLDYPYEDSIDFEVASDQEIEEYQTKLSRHFADRLPNLDGFIIIDEENNYKINLSAGWKENLE